MYKHRLGFRLTDDQLSKLIYIHHHFIGEINNLTLNISDILRMLIEFEYEQIIGVESIENERKQKIRKNKDDTSCRISCQKDNLQYK